MKSPKEIGETIRELRGKESLRDFAAKCDISHTSLDAIEKGYNFRTGKPTFPSTMTLEKIANGANVPLSYLIDSDDKNKNSIFSKPLKIGLQCSRTKTSLAKPMNDILKQLRTCRGYSQKELATLLGISTSAIGMYEIGERTPDKEILQKYVDFFSVDYNYLYGIDEFSCESHNPEFYNTSSPHNSLGDIEKELLRICENLDMRKKNILLSKAYELLES